MRGNKTLISVAAASVNKATKYENCDFIQRAHELCDEIMFSHFYASTREMHA